MPRKRTPVTSAAAAWFTQFPPVDPPGWDDKDGWCRRHWAPLASITDPDLRAMAQRLASLELMVVFAAEVRRRVAPLPVPAHKLTALVRALTPVCCYVGDGKVQEIILAAGVFAAAEKETATS